MLLCAAPVYAQSGKPNPYQFTYKPLVPRVDVQIRSAKHRTMLLTEMWMPLAQQQDRVLYADVRYMDDNRSNIEGNLGIGYRQIASVWHTPERVWGGHAWLDRRRTRYNSMFYQAVIGFETLGEKNDLRANVYIPLSSRRHFYLPFTGSTAPYFVGTGVYYDRPGIAVEEPQRGFDFEFGRRVNLFEKHIDSFRIYNGAYYFRGDRTENVTGARSRLEVNFTPSFTVGSRVQYDNVRGGQAFLEATIRFPFSAKADFKTQKLRARLDESPERDIDIVTNGAIVDHGLLNPLINPNTGSIQRVFHVDNTPLVLGNGASHAPFGSLKEAEDVLRPYDVLYIHQGIAAAEGMDRGLTISTPNVTVIGSGAHLVYDAGRFYGADPHGPVTGNVLIAATQSPVIANIHGKAGENSALTISADNVSIKGIALGYSGGNGIKIVADGTELKNIDLDMIDVFYNAENGVWMEARNGGSIRNVSITNSRFVSNIQSGMVFNTADKYAQIRDIRLSGNEIAHNNQRGIDVSFTQGTIHDFRIEDNLLLENRNGGLTIHTAGEAHFEGVIERNRMVGNIAEGMAFRTTDYGTLAASVSENTITQTYHPGGLPSYGLVLDHDAAGSGFNVDLGGGSLHSIGRNRIYNNDTHDVFLDTRAGMDPMTDGLTVSALYNYWGPTGLDKLSHVFADDNENQFIFSKIDARHFLYF